MNDETLKPCPFPVCGSTNVKVGRICDQDPDCWVECQDCGAEGPFAYSDKEAIRKWNTRPEPEAPKRFVSGRQVMEHYEATGEPEAREAVADLFKDYPEVLLFAKAMLYKLRKNAHKDGWPTMSDKGRTWKDCPRSFLQDKLREETQELLDELNKVVSIPLDTLDEAADVGNIAMMLADNAGILHAAGHCRCAENSHGVQARWCELCNPKPPPDDEARRLLGHCAAVMRGVVELCQPKPRQSFDDHTEYAGGQALEELRNCVDAIEAHLAQTDGKGE